MAVKDTILKLFKPLNDEMFDTKRDLKIEYKDDTYIFTWKQAVNTPDRIVINVPCEYKITELDIIEQMIRDKMDTLRLK